MIYLCEACTYCYFSCIRFLKFDFGQYCFISFAVSETSAKADSPLLSPGFEQKSKEDLVQAMDKVDRELSKVLRIAAIQNIGFLSHIKVHHDIWKCFLFSKAVTSFVLGRETMKE